jgi:Cdc6-like AAA superfamily ATPase
MGDFAQFLDPDEIKDLSTEEAERLQRVMDHEIYTSNEIKEILRQRVRQVFDELKQRRGESTP